jgi:uncharacterized protein DUF4386
MSSTKATARLAGILYIVMGIPAWFSLMSIPSALYVHGNATATMHNIMNAEPLYRLGILSELVSQTIFIFLVLVFYDLFKDVDRKQARLMVTLVVVAVAIEFVNCVNLIAPLVVLSGADYLSVFSKPQLDALAFTFLRLRHSGLDVVGLLWGLWLVPLGVLAIKSRFIPRLLGILVIAAGVAYVAGSITAIIWPAQRDIVSRFTLPIGGAGELLLVLWLLVIGVKENPLEAQTT